MLSKAFEITCHKERLLNVAMHDMQYLGIGSRLANIKQHPGVIEIKGQILIVLKIGFVGSERVLTYTYSDRFFLL